MVWRLLIHTNYFYGYFVSKIRLMQPCFGLRRNSANLLGKSGQLVLLSLVPNTTKPFQNYYVEILWDLKHTNIPHKLNG